MGLGVDNEVAMVAMDVRTDLRAGQAALSQCDWAEARVAFERAVQRGGEPEALEGLAQAAFFLDEPDAAVDAHERAYAAYRKVDRPGDAARVAIALAWEDRAYRGEPAVSDGWLGRARRLLEGSGPTRERGWLVLREASFALPGDPTLARERSAEAESLGRQLGDIDVEMTASALSGLALVSQGEGVAGMARLDEATMAATAGEMSDPVAIGFSCCYLIFACERVRDLDRAAQWCQRLAAVFAHQNVVRPAGGGACPLRNRADAPWRVGAGGDRAGRRLIGAGTDPTRGSGRVRAPWGTAPTPG